jgi:hypothetical protein
MNATLFRCGVLLLGTLFAGPLLAIDRSEEYVAAARNALNVTDDGPLAAAHPLVAERLKLDDTQRAEFDIYFRRLALIRVEAAHASSRSRSLKEEFPQNGSNEKEMREEAIRSSNLHKEMKRLEAEIPATIKALLTENQRAALEKLKPPQLRIEPFDLGIRPTRGMNLDGSGARLVVTSESQVMVIDLASRKSILTLGDDKRLMGMPVVISRDGKQLLCAWRIEKQPIPELEIWDIDQQKPIVRYDWKGSPKVSWHTVNVDEDSLHVVAYSWESGHQVKQWKLTTGEEDRTLVNANVDTVTLSPDGKLLATTDSSGLKLWDTRDGRELHRLTVFDTALSGGPGRGVFSSDGKLLAACSGGGWVRVFDTATGKTLQTVACAGERAIQCAFGHNDEWLVCSTDSAVTVWDLKEQRELGVRQEENDPRNQSWPTSATARDTIVAWFDGKLAVVTVEKRE